MPLLCDVRSLSSSILVHIVDNLPENSNRTGRSRHPKTVDKLPEFSETVSMIHEDSRMALAKDFIDGQIPAAHQDMLPSTLRAAYKTVKALAEKTDFLKTPPATFARGHLVAWAAEFQIFRLIRDGIWPYDCEWVPYTKPTGQYLRIDTGAAFVTISQLMDMKEGPRFAVFRDNAALANYPLLPFEEFAREAEENNRKHLVIGHGYQDLNFIFIGAPKPKSKRWIDRTENLLLRHPFEGEQPVVAEESPHDENQAPEEGADITIDIELTEHLKKQVRDSNG
jgi:hypothetical protein